VSDIALIQLLDEAPPGLLEPWAAHRGLTLRVVRPDRGEALPVDARAAIVLGSDDSVNDGSLAYNAPLIAWAAEVLRRQTPTLGICFGAQLMARALGAQVVRLPAPEIGWVAVSEETDGVGAGPWMQWHEDGIVVDGAPLRVVASNECGVQALRAAPGQLGVQFHPEVTPAIVADWCRSDQRGQLATVPTTAEELERHSRRHAETAAAAAYALFDGWAREAALVSG
jgi:GMP synthase-like glutamine amidotransferase